MKTIDTLADDIKGLFGATLRGDSHTFEEDVLARFGSSVALHVADSLRARTGGRKPKTLYMSEIGKPCIRQVWYGYHYPELAEQMQEHTLFKFFYGDVIEEATLLLAEAAGHKVERRQELTDIALGEWHVRGRKDAVVDGVLVDVKSCSPYGYKKFQEGLNDDNDSFGYRLQLSGYNEHQEFDRQGFIAVDKQNGHIGFFEQPFINPKSRVINIITALEDEHCPPDRAFKLEPMGTSGNEKLCTECSYCPYKQECWGDANDGAGLRTFLYSTGPVFLGTVKREPKAPELHPIKLERGVVCPESSLSEMPTSMSTKA